jgi:hypothetical protein
MSLIHSADYWLGRRRSCFVLGFIGCLEFAVARGCQASGFVLPLDFCSWLSVWLSLCASKQFMLISHFLCAWLGCVFDFQIACVVARLVLHAIQSPGPGPLLLDLVHKMCSMKCT